MFWNRKKTKKYNGCHAMIMLRTNESFNIDSLISDFNRNYSNKLLDVTRNEEATTFRLDGDLYGIVHINVPIPGGDIAWASEFAHNWRTAVDDLKDHQGHVIINAFLGSLEQIDRFKVLTQLVFSLLRTSDAIGVYKGNQRLLIQKDKYLEGEMLMRNGALPLLLWVYLGMFSNKGKNCALTQGLKEFNKMEMEIIDSSKTVKEIWDFLYDISYYVLGKDVNFKGGETFTTDNAYRVKITRSKGVLHQDEDTLKLQF